MYSSLQKIDIMVEDAGRKLAVQTDHRPAAEVEGEWALSAIFAVARVRNPLMSGQAEAVRVAMIDGASDRYALLLTQLGAEVELGMGGTIRPAALDLEAARVTLEDAVRTLGATVFAEYAVAPDQAGLQRAEAEERALLMGPMEEDEIGFWTRVVRLGAALCVAQAALYGGSLVLATEMVGMVPLKWRVDASQLNCFGRCEEYIERDPSYLPSLQLAAMADQRNTAEGTPMLLFRPTTWAGRAHGHHTMLLEMPGDNAPDIPLVALVRDLPNTTATTPKETPAEEIAAMHAEAVRNLAAVEVDIQEAEVDGAALLMVGGHYYAAEKCLLPEFMLELGARIKSELLLVGLPRRGMMVVRSGLSSPNAAAAFLMAVKAQHDEAPPQERISTQVFLFTEGAPAGLAHVQQNAEEPKKKGFWARLFGR